jgi:hypothetical protein
MNCNNPPESRREKSLEMEQTLPIYFYDSGPDKAWMIPSQLVGLQM